MPPQLASSFYLYLPCQISIQQSEWYYSLCHNLCHVPVQGFPTPLREKSQNPYNHPQGLIQCTPSPLASSPTAPTHLLQPHGPLAALWVLQALAAQGLSLGVPPTSCRPPAISWLTPPSSESHSSVIISVRPSPMTRVNYTTSLKLPIPAPCVSFLHSTFSNMIAITHLFGLWSVSCH